MARYLRNKRDGTIYGWSVHLCENPDVEECSEFEAFPERHIPASQVGRVSALALDTDVAVLDELTVTPKKKTKAALAADAAKGFGSR